MTWDNDTRRREYQRRLRKGLCVRGGCREAAVKGQTCCERHREANRERMAKAKNYTIAITFPVSWNRVIYNAADDAGMPTYDFVRSVLIAAAKRVRDGAARVSNT